MEAFLECDLLLVADFMGSTVIGLALIVSPKFRGETIAVEALAPMRGLEVVF
jgi:hypothetical protein